MERESFRTRLGFLLTSAGCAIGLGNVWRFPYITGRYGGALFVLLYLVFLFLIGFPLMVAELAVGRGGQSDMPGAMEKLEHKKHGLRWSSGGHIAFWGSAVLMTFYPAITGWLLDYTADYCCGGMTSGAPALSKENFSALLGNWQEMLLYTLGALLITGVICGRGLQSGIERSIKVMMGGLFLLQLCLIVLACTLPNGSAGIRYFLAPDLKGLRTFGALEVIYAAMTQALFTLSLGVGSIAICGSYMGKERSLAGEAVIIIVLDTLAAIASGLIIFPTCFSFGQDPGAGPSLIFITLPMAFGSVRGGRLLGALFFLFMSIAALSTLVAVCENLIAYAMRRWSWSRCKATFFCMAALAVLNLPCIFGFNLWKRFEPLGKGTNVLDLEDFIISGNLLPLGGMLIVLFCTRRSGWGAEEFYAEANTGNGMRFPRFMRAYMTWGLPLVIFVIWAAGLFLQFR